MDYENFYTEVQALEKVLKDKLAQTQRGYRLITKDAEKGDTKKLAQNLADIQIRLAEASAAAAELAALNDGFDGHGYMESGGFAKQMVALCNRLGVDVKEEPPYFEMFPYRIRVDAENTDVYVNRKKLPCVRPLYFVQTMKQDLDKYWKSAFSHQQFLNELAAAYDLALLVRNADSKVPRKEMDLHLKDLYEYLAPTAKARRDYDIRQYAFDLARLCRADPDAITRDGRRYAFGTAKQMAKQIRILDEHGMERFLGMIRFYRPEGEVTNG